MKTIQEKLTNILTQITRSQDGISSIKIHTKQSHAIFHNNLASGVASFQWARVQKDPHGPLFGPVRPTALRSYQYCGPLEVVGLGTLHPLLI